MGLFPKIDFISFFQKGVSIINEDFSINLITGYQGSGKTYFSIYKVERYFKPNIVYTNIKSYTSSKHRVVYFTRIEELYSNIDVHNCIVIIDELSKKYVKNSPQDRLFYSWLQQCRKNNRHVFMITQEYLQVPQWLRGVANTIYTTSKIFLLPLFKTSFGVPVLDKDTMEWDISINGSIIYKRTKYISSLYDTYEPVPIL